MQGMADFLDGGELGYYATTFYIAYQAAHLVRLEAIAA